MLEPLLPPLSIGGKKLALLAGSVLDWQGDAFVNAANEGCVGGFGIDEVVNQAGGPELKSARKQLGGCPTGHAKSTLAYSHTKTKHVVHAVGPVYRVNRVKQGFDEEDARAGPHMRSLDPLLRDAYRASLRCAGSECGASSVGFCLLSAGVFRGSRPLEAVVEIGLRTLVHALATSSACAEGIESVAVCAFAPEEQQALRAAGERVSHELASGGDGSDHDLTRELLKG